MRNFSQQWLWKNYHIDSLWICVLRYVTVASSGCARMHMWFGSSYIRHCVRGEASTGWTEKLDAKQQGTPTCLLKRSDEKRFYSQVVLRRGEGKCFSDPCFWQEMREVFYLFFILLLNGPESVLPVGRHLV